MAITPIGTQIDLHVHFNPRVYTEFNNMMMTWHVVLQCCGKKYLAAITQEYLMDALQTPEAITWELFKLFREFIILHPSHRQLIMKLTHGSMEKKLVNEPIAVGNNKYTWSGYDINWVPSGEFFSMSVTEAAWWDKEIENLHPEDTQKHKDHFFGNYKVVDADSSWLTAESSWNQQSDTWNEYHFSDITHDPGVAISHSVGRDERVSQLPGIFETVKHPVHNSTERIIGMDGKPLSAVMHSPWSLEMVIIDLNDNHGWTREQIADWLETLDIDIRFRGEDSDERS